MSNRRKLRANRKTPATTAPAWTAARPPWNKGLSLTDQPSVSTMRRRLRLMEAAGVVERTTDRSGKPGRPAHLWSVTEEGRLFRAASEALARSRGDLSALSPEHADVLIRLGYAARDSAGGWVFLEDWRAAYEYWRSKESSAAGAAS